LKIWGRLKTVRLREQTDYPGMHNQMTWLLKNNLFQLYLKGDMTTGKWSERCNIAGSEDGGGGHEPRSVEMDSFLEPPERNAALHFLILVRHVVSIVTYIINLCCLKPRSVNSNSKLIHYYPYIVDY
jgi:hypothetical protein